MLINPAQHFINLKRSEFDKPIYRIMPVHRLLECLDQKALTLIEPAKWDDPFENLLLKGFMQHSSPDAVALKVFRQSVYGQCWTFHRETDAMWRIYSPDKHGVKVRTTIRKLISALVSHEEENRARACFIGKVNYLKQDDLVSKLSGISGIYGKDAAESLLYKRREFSHEKEVRLIYTMHSKLGDVHKFKIDPNDLFEEIVFDPRMNEHVYNAYRGAVFSKKYSNSIRQSVLYKLPNELLKSIQQAH